MLEQEARHVCPARTDARSRGAQHQHQCLVRIDPAHETRNPGVVCGHLMDMRATRARGLRLKCIRRVIRRHETRGNL